MNGGPPVPEAEEIPDGSPRYGLWPGTVVDTKDSEQRGRIRVRVDQVYGAADAAADEKIADDELPWAQPCFPWVGADVGAYHVPPPGAGVWVSFWQGDHKFPVWMGGWAGDGDAPAQFTGAYGKGDPQPCTYLVKTPTGHSIEMRWCPSEEQIKVLTAQGGELSMIDATALGGPKVVLKTPAGFTLEEDETLGRISLRTPTGFELLLNQTGGLASLATPGGNSLVLGDTAGTVTLTAVAILALVAGGAMTITAAALTIASIGLLSFTGAGLALLTTAGAITIGAAGVFQALATAQFVNTTYLGHVHGGVTAGGGTTGPPTTGTAPGDLTTNTTAN